MPDLFDGVSGGGAVLAEERFGACDRVTCLNLTRRLCLELVLGLENIRADLMSEAGPYPAGAEANARHLAGALETIDKMRREKMNFRKLARCNLPDVDRILLHRLPEVLRGVKEYVHEPLKNAPGDERGAKELIEKMVSVLQPYAVEALACAEEANLHLLAQFAALVEGSLVEAEPQQQVFAVVSCDLCEYGRHSRIVNDLLNLETLRLFDQQIEDLLRRCLAAGGEAARGATYLDAGDGAMILLGEPVAAVDFALRVMKAVADRNLTVTDTDLHWRFRIGISTGEICRIETKTPAGTVVKVRTSGLALARAVRLQAAAAQNSVIVGARTWSQIPPDQQALFSGEEQIPGKSHEDAWPGHRLRPSEASAGTAPA